jgi:carboxypeptidase D
MWAGHLEITPEHHGNLFFWLVKNRHIANKQRTVIWLNGGPGCSSMDGALMEIGPYRVNKDGTLRLQDGSWDEFANVLFVDQPVGTGFSYVDTNSYVHEMDEMAEQMITFLKKLFDIFPEYRHTEVCWAQRSGGRNMAANRFHSCTLQESRTQDNGYLTSATPSSS